MTEQNPYAYGYARMPRIIRKGYKNLTNLQKLLYIYLRDLCGEDGTCYRSLRSLKEETGFSIGYLSDAIPLLHNEGLIHAEMRKTPSTHWEVWHISVVDIWEKNAAFLQAEKAKCSPDEQLDSQSVQDMNRSVHQMNKIAESVHPVNESVHAMTLNKNPDREPNITENNEREGDTALDAPTPARASSLSQQIGKRLSDPRLTAITADMLEDRDRQSHADGWQASPIADDELDPEATVKVPAITKGNTHGFSDRTAAGQHSNVNIYRHDTAGEDSVLAGSPVASADAGLPAGDAGRRVGDSAQVAPAQTVRGASDPPVSLTGGAAALSPSAGTLPPRASTQGEPRAPGAKVPKRPKAEKPEPKGPPQMPAEDAPWTTRTCLQLFDAWRGAYLIGKFKNMQASTCAKGLVEQYTREQVEEAKARMDKDKYYIERGGADVCDVANNIHKYRRKQKPVEQLEPYSFAWLEAQSRA